MLMELRAEKSGCSSSKKFSCVEESELRSAKLDFLKQLYRSLNFLNSSLEARGLKITLPESLVSAFYLKILESCTSFLFSLTLGSRYHP